MKLLFSVHWVLISALWYLVNGILHDIFVLINHKGKYDRGLLYLLLNGHILIVSGAIVLVSYFLMLNNVQGAGWITIIAATGMLIYCGMIFTFLRSFGTIIVSVILILVSIYTLTASL